MDALRASFRPEFLNRVDEMIIFHSLQKSQLRQIVKLQAKSLEKRLADQKIGLSLSESALDFLADVGYEAQEYFFEGDASAFTNTSDLLNDASRKATA